MKRIMTIVLLIFQIVVFSATKSYPSEAVGFSTTSCDTMPGFDYHYVSLLFEEGLTVSSDIDSTGYYINCISEYDNVNKGWNTSSYYPDSLSGLWLNEFSVSLGKALSFHSIQNDFNFVSTGVYTEILSYDLIEGSNFIAHPMRRYDLTTTLELGEDIGVCNAVREWDPANQGWLLSYQGLFYGWVNEFSIDIGTQLFINVTNSVIWPHDGAKEYLNTKETTIAELTTPKVIYYSVVNSSKINYDFTSKVNNITFQSWITGREDDIITESTYGCGFEQLGDTFSSIYINIGNFKNRWKPGDVVNLKVIDQSSKDPKTWKSGKGKYKLKKKSDSIFRGFKPKIKDSGEPIVIGDPTTIETNIPFETKLYQNYPNPFNPTTTIKFSLKEESQISLNIYNYSGQLVKALVNEKRENGFHKIEFDASQFSSGVYYYTLKTDTRTFTKRMLMVK